VLLCRPLFAAVLPPSADFLLHHPRATPLPAEIGGEHEACNVELQAIFDGRRADRKRATDRKRRSTDQQRLADRMRRIAWERLAARQLCAAQEAALEALFSTGASLAPRVDL